MPCRRARPYVAAENRFDPDPSASPPINRLGHYTCRGFPPDIRSHPASPPHPDHEAAVETLGRLLVQHRVEGAGARLLRVVFEEIDHVPPAAMVVGVLEHRPP